MKDIIRVKIERGKATIEGSQFAMFCLITDLPKFADANNEQEKVAIDIFNRIRQALIDYEEMEEPLEINYTKQFKANQ